MKRSKPAPLFGIQILYLMLHVPCVWWVKIGITGQTAKKRASWIDKEMWGFPVPLFFVVIPYAYEVEQWLHEICGVLNVRFYKGSGCSEWFWLPAVLVAVPTMVVLFAIFILAALALALFAVYAIGNI